MKLLNKGYYKQGKYISRDRIEYVHLCDNCKKSFRECCPEITTKAVSKCPDYIPKPYI